MPVITRPAMASGRVQRNGPEVACGAGLVNTSSVGMFGVICRPRTSITPPCQLAPSGSARWRSVPGARSRIVRRSSAVRRAARAVSASA